MAKTSRINMYNTLTESSGDVKREIKALAVNSNTFYRVGETIFNFEITSIKHIPNINTFEIYSYEDLIIEVVADRYTVFYIQPE